VVRAPARRHHIRGRAQARPRAGERERALFYFAAGIHEVLVLSYVNAGAVFKASLVVFKTKYHLPFTIFHAPAHVAKGNRYILFAHTQKSADANDQGGDITFFVDKNVIDVADLIV
jgi:hypothetical protein